MTRRQLIVAGAGLALSGALASRPARGLTINPRSAWGADLPPKGPLEPEEVEFLIVHHSASHNGHTAADVPSILRSWYHYHTGPEKGWNDVAYNFVIDSEGGIWEARQGSIDGPVAGDATGGNQGYTQLVAIIGDYNEAHPTQASLTSLVHLLAWLADRYGVSTAPGAEVTFISKGSNKWPEGTSVTTPTITGHRTMSKTTCPGDNLNSYVTGALTSDVEAVRNGESSLSSETTTSAATSTTVTTTTPTTTTTTTTLAPTSALSGPGPTSSTPLSTAGSEAVAPPTTTPITVPLAVEDSLVAPGSRPLLIGAGSLIALGSGLLVWRLNRLRR